jgi:dTMP kinase
MNVSMVTPDVLSVAVTLLKIITDPKAAKQLLADIEKATHDHNNALAAAQLEGRNAASTLATIVDRTATLDAREAALAAAERAAAEKQAAADAGAAETAAAREKFDREKRIFVDGQAARARALDEREAALAAVQASVDAREAAVAEREAKVSDREARIRAAVEA